MVFRDKKDRYRYDTKFELPVINHYLTSFVIKVGFRHCECSNVAINMCRYIPYEDYIKTSPHSGGLLHTITTAGTVICVVANVDVFYNLLINRKGNIIREGPAFLFLLSHCHTP